MAKLVWLPTWHQARLLAGLMGIDVKEIYGIRSSGSIETPGDELHLLYEILLAKLHSGQ